ncbi:transmembrane protein 125 [Myxocyprinus asiaticus]|uniref:transmembrane protein 125 n=1 Tax=Myxocyprinus asiaticus TaxID=70543 RepID=UPI0022235CDB|nr:transmembrane protein 125 [Myxocyprinus asiaticus]XP_051554127.1 transmembrane protein 125 [Myxocyprinus asiaticus]XP_051554128.1 transmembrane protein 125 [Myxocyprinus asiaticus]
MELLPLSVLSPGAPLHLQVDPSWLQRQAVEDQVELWWFSEPHVSILCYCFSVAMVLGLGSAGVGFLSAASSAVGLSALWRLGVGSTLCLLALVVLLKQLLSSAVQDMGCIRSRRRIEQLRTGGTADPVLLLFTGLALVVCGTTLLSLTQSDMLLSGVILLATGSAVVLGVMVYGVVVHVQGRRNTRRRRRRQRVRVYTVTGQRNRPWRDSNSSQSNLL